MALLRLLSITAAVAGIFFAAFVFAACGDDDDDDTPTGTPTATPTAPETTNTPTISPGTPTPRPGGTITPTPDANTSAGFVEAVKQLNRELSAGRLDPFVSRVHVREYTCKATDLSDVLGAVQACTKEGEVLRIVSTSGWRSEGSLVKVEDFVANLQNLQTQFATDKSDEFGAGTLRVFAYDSTKHTAVVTVISKCLPDYRCGESGLQRLVWVPQFEYVDGRWMIERLMSAFVLGEEFLTADGPGSGIYLPDWEPLD